MTDTYLLNFTNGSLSTDLKLSTDVDKMRALSGPIAHQVKTLRGYEDPNELHRMELGDGPVGFPLMLGDDSDGVLAWCATQHVWSGKSQAELFVTAFNRAKKLPKGAAKRLVKDWSPVATGAQGDCASYLTLQLLTPALRNDLTLDMTMGKAWLFGPVGHFIRAGHRWTGLPDPTTLEAFIQQHLDWIPPESEPRRYWPTELWPFDVAPESEPLQRALINFLHRTLILARKWDTLDERQCNGILLSAYGAACMLCTTAVLMPFAALSAELRTRLQLHQLAYDGLCDTKGRPTSLLEHTLSLAHLVYGEDNPPGELALQLISPVSRQLDNLLLNADRVRGDLRDYRTLYLRAAHPRVKAYVEAARTHIDSLPDDCQQAVAAAQDDVEAWGRLSQALPSDAPDGHLNDVEIDYWQKQYLAVVDHLPRDVSFKEWLNQQLTAITGESMDALQTQAAEAVARMDTERLSELVGRMAAQKNATATAVRDYLAPVRLPQELRDKAPQPVPEAEADPLLAQELSALRARVVELEQETEQQAELLNLHDENETDLNRQLEGLRGELHHEQQRAESLSHQLAGKQQSTAALGQPPEAVLRALSEAATLKDALDAAAALYPDTVEVLPSAYAGIKTSGYKNVRKVVDQLTRLCGPYYNAVVREGVGDAKARDILGAVFKAQESDTTLKVDKLRTQREFRYQGDTVLFEKHLTLGVKRGDQACLQIYFKIIDGKLVIAYCGPHLDTAST